MTEVTVVVLARAKPGRGEEARVAFREVTEPTHAEDGCLLYALHAVRGDPDRIVLVERWASREALDEHLASRHLTEFRERSAELWAEPVEILLVDPLRAGDPVKGAIAPA